MIQDGLVQDTLILYWLKYVNDRSLATRYFAAETMNGLSLSLFERDHTMIQTLLSKENITEYTLSTQISLDTGQTPVLKSCLVCEGFVSTFRVAVVASAVA